ncbi:MAG: response regulator [Leptolyngbya sp. SIO4C1]|nr:response regulator [Leptolyngbya sp. SIO4C1]
MHKTQIPTLLVVEDSDEDFEALGRILRKASDVDIPMQRCIDGDEALELLQTSRSAVQKEIYRPGLIVLDLNLPGTDGREVLAKIKQDDLLKTIPVIVFTTSSNPKDIETCYRYGVNSYMIKPMNVQHLKDSIQLFIDYWFKVVVLPS